VITRERNETKCSVDPSVIQMQDTRGKSLLFQQQNYMLCLSYKTVAFNMSLMQQKSKLHHISQLKFNNKIQNNCKHITVHRS